MTTLYKLVGCGWGPLEWLRGVRLGPFIFLPGDGGGFGSMDLLGLVGCPVPKDEDTERLRGGRSDRYVALS